MAVDKEFIEQVKKLRMETGAGIMDCRKALEESRGDLEQARKILKQRGLAIAARKAGREAREGLIEAYIHFSGRFGALVELNCETDFVARTEEFKQLAKDLALQVAGMNPRYVTHEDVPEEEILKIKESLLFDEPNLSPHSADFEEKLKNRMQRYYAEHCLMDQPYVKEQSRLIRELITEAIARLGENIIVRRFTRFELGE